MEENTNTEETATLCPTKSGNGYKVVVDGKWFHTSKKKFRALLDTGKNCVFSTITDESRER
jgi:hypothetical protein